MKIKSNKSVAQAYESYVNRATAKNSDKAIYESWAPTIKKITGVEDADKLAWMSQLAHNTAKLNEDAFVMPSNAYSYGSFATELREASKPFFSAP